MKLSIEFEITKTRDDYAEGEWHVHKSDSFVCPHYMMRESIRHDLLCNETILDAWYIDSAQANRKLEKRLAVSLFTNGGRVPEDEEVEGTFVAWKDGIPC